MKEQLSYQAENRTTEWMLFGHTQTTRVKKNGQKSERPSKVSGDIVDYSCTT